MVLRSLPQKRISENPCLSYGLEQLGLNQHADISPKKASNWTERPRHLEAVGWGWEIPQGGAEAPSEDFKQE